MRTYFHTAQSSLPNNSNSFSTPNLNKSSYIKMSLRSDSYFSLCLEQANKSPLYFRHGCIIVRGGKVLGQGYNTYRPGFDGGALKHGNMVGGFNSLSVAEFKQHLKQKKKLVLSLSRQISDPVVHSHPSKTLWVDII
jgi:hypothetical protein